MAELYMPRPTRSSSTNREWESVLFAHVQSRWLPIRNWTHLRALTARSPYVTADEQHCVCLFPSRTHTGTGIHRQLLNVDSNAWSGRKPFHPTEYICVRGTEMEDQTSPCIRDAARRRRCLLQILVLPECYFGFEICSWFSSNMLETPSLRA